MNFIKFLWHKRNEESFEAGLLRYIYKHEYEIQMVLKTPWRANEHSIESVQRYGFYIKLEKQWWTGQYTLKKNVNVLSIFDNFYSHYLLKELTLWLESKNIEVIDINENNIKHYVKLLDIYVNNSHEFENSRNMWKTLQYVDGQDVAIQEEEELIL